VTLLQRLSSRFNEARDISATIDGAFFENGSFVGADNTRFFKKFTSEVHARQSLAQRIVESGRRGRDVTYVAREIQESLPTVPPKLTLASYGTLQEYEDYYSPVFCQLGLHRRIEAKRKQVDSQRVLPASPGPMPVALSVDQALPPAQCIVLNVPLT